MLFTEKTNSIFNFPQNNNIVFLDLYKMLEATGQSSCVSAVTTY